MVKRIFKNYLFVFPALLLFAVFSIYPFIKIFQLSVYRWDGIMPTMKFVGIFNFKDIIFHNPIWWRSMWQAAYITLIALTLQNALALVLALICDRGIKFGNGYRVIFFIPPVLSGIVVGLIWNWIYNGNYGLLNHWLAQLSKWMHISYFSNLERAWLADPRTALTSVAIINMWKGFGWGFLVLLAGLQSIPRQLYEAAKVDGAGRIQSFRYITLPFITPLILTSIVFFTAWYLAAFDLIYGMTGGGPGFSNAVLAYKIFQESFTNLNFGYASAIGIVLFFLVSLGGLIGLFALRRQEITR